MTSHLYVRVKHCSQVVDVFIPHAETATIKTLKEAIDDKLRIPSSKQRLLFSSNPKNNKLGDDALLVQVAKVGSRMPLGAAAPPMVMVVGTSEIHLPLVAQGGTGGEAPAVSSRCCSAAEMKRLVAVSVDNDDGLYSCSYSSGYVSQDVYYCRTCTDRGFAEKQHFICFACAELCHGDHTVEHWGQHNYFRCDCCTVTCLTEAAELEAKRVAESTESKLEDDADAVAPARCRFVVDESSHEIPKKPVMRNVENRYPSDTEHWCYCLGEDATPEEDEDGLNCMLCHSGFYCSHITRLETTTFRLLSCYAETDGYNTIGIRCRTCFPPSSTPAQENVLCCPSCAVFCHRGHDLDTNVVPIHYDGEGEGAITTLQCSCRASCTIAHDTPKSALMEGVDATGKDLLVPQWLAKKLVEDDEICAFLCATCMQKYPWLWQAHGADPIAHIDSLRRCYNGKLPDASMDIKPVIKCRVSTVTDEDADRFPYHGMVVPEDLSKCLCPCKACQDAFQQFAPRKVSDSGLQLLVPYHNRCSQCNVAVERSAGYLCTTCEIEQPPEMQGASFFLCDSCYESTDAVQRHRAAIVTQRSHEFVQDSFENLWNLFGATLVRHADPATKEWMMNHWNDGASRDMFLDLMRSSFGAKRLREDEHVDDDDGDKKRRTE